MRRNTRKAQKGGIRLLDSNYAMPRRAGYYEGGIFEGVPGTEGISREWIDNRLSENLTGIPGLSDDDAERLKRIGIETTIQLIGVAMMITGATENSGAPLVFYLRKVGLKHPALVARMVIEKLGRMLRRATDYEHPIVPSAPNGVNYPDIDIPQLILADYAEKYGLTLDEVSDMVRKRSEYAVESYAEKRGLTPDDVPAGKRSEYFKHIVSHLPAEMAAFNRRKHAVKAFATLREPAAATAAAAGAAASTKLRRQTRRRRI